MPLIYLFQYPLPITTDGALNLIQYENSHEGLMIKALHRPTVPRLSAIATETKITADEEKIREEKRANYALETNAAMTATTTTNTKSNTKEWCLGIDFAPVNLNLSLPTPNELLRRDKPVYY